MEKVLNLGYIDYYGENKKNKVTLEVELKQKEKGICLSICGNIWNRNCSDIVAGGQCSDTIKMFFSHDKKIMRIVEIWERYHLNDLKAGTPKQEKFIEEWTKGNKYEYAKVCEALKQEGIYIDNGYKYGSKWLFEEIPQNIIEEIKSW